MKRTYSIVMGILSWLVFSIGVYLLLRPVLITAVVADDFIGPFSQFHQAGPGLTSSLKFGYDAASYGHFNYVGQVFGAAASWTWMQLQGRFGLRYSTIYAGTKFLVLLLAICSAARLARRVTTRNLPDISVWKFRVAIALALASTIQLHIVWSNDPVGSYPLSGYLSVALGMLVLDFAHQFFNEQSLRNWLFVNAFLATAILYYEMNISLLAAVGVIGLIYVVMPTDRQQSFLVRASYTASTLVLPAVMTVYLQLHNSAKSASYTGTSVALNGKLLHVFGNSLISSLPFSSWHLAFDWLPNGVTFRIGIFALPTIGLLLLLSTAMRRNGAQVALGRIQLVNLLGPLLTYWLIATLIQSATVKVQSEATRIGSVYNFYAVGSLVVAVFLALLGIVVAQRFSKNLVRFSLISLLLLGVVSQFAINDSLAIRHAGYLTYNRNLLVQFTEQSTRDSRCAALQQWLSMAWPDYYKNHMTVGLEAAYQHFHKEPFCGRF